MSVRDAVSCFSSAGISALSLIWRVLPELKINVCVFVFSRDNEIEVGTALDEDMDERAVVVHW